MNETFSEQVSSSVRPAASQSYRGVSPDACDSLAGGGQIVVGRTGGPATLVEPASSTAAVRSTPIDRLPDELVTEIFGRMDDSTLARAQSTSRRFAAIAASPDLPLLRRQCLEKAAVAAQSMPQPFAEQQVRRLFGDHLANISERRAVEDACAWIEVLSTEEERPAVPYAPFRAGLFGPCLRAALMKTSAALQEMCEAPPQNSLLATLEQLTGLEEVALDLLPLVRGKLLDTPFVLWGPLATARRFGLRTSLEERQLTLEVGLLQGRVTRFLSGAPLLLDALSNVQPEARTSWLFDRLSEHQQPVFDLFCAHHAHFDWLRDQIPSFAPEDALLELRRVVFFLFAQNFSSVEAGKYLKVLSSPIASFMRAEIAETLTGRLEKLSDECEVYLHRIVRELGPRALLMTILEVNTRESAGTGNATTSQIADRRAQLRQQFPQQSAPALAQVRNRFPQLAQVVVDHLHLMMGDVFLDLRRAARDGSESPYAELYCAELVAATQTQWPDIVPSQVQQGEV